MHHPFYKLGRNQRGASHIVVALLIVVGCVVGFTGYRLQKMSHADTVNLGTTTIGSTPENLNVNYKIASPYTASAGGKVATMDLYVDGKLRLPGVARSALQSTLTMLASLATYLVTRQHKRFPPANQLDGFRSISGFPSGSLLTPNTGSPPQQATKQ